MQKAKWLSEEALQIVEGKKKNKKQRRKKKKKYAHLNSEFQRTARRDKKAFFSDQCKDRGK